MTSRRQWVVGSAEDCDQIVSAPTVSSRHCRLIQTDGGFQIEDLGSTNGTFVNGRRINGLTRVGGNDSIMLGGNVPLALPSIGEGPVTVIRVGREPDNDLVLDHPSVSGHHALVMLVDGQASIEDLGSTNGTAIGASKNRITKSRLAQNDVVFFGTVRMPAARLLDNPAPIGAISNDVLTIGRESSCDVFIDHPLVSRQHARLTRTQAGFLLEDLDSVNGTFVGGNRVSTPADLYPGDEIEIGGQTLVLLTDGRLEPVGQRGNVTIEVRSVAIDVPGRRLLDDISLVISPGEFVGLMGPSGAGKTTLMNTLNGYTPPTEGSVHYNGYDLYANYSRFSGLMGYVPQDDIIHSDLTVGEALFYTARLRLPPDFSNDDLRARIASVLDQLGLKGTEDVLVGSPEKKGISGGQRKRVNLAMELLTDPAVLFLDEPTSGLSSEDALKVMRVLRGLADAGKSILLTIHQPSIDAYRLMDLLVLVGRDAGSPEPGRLVYYGSAYPDAIHFFNPHLADASKQGVDVFPDEVLRGLAKRPSREWVQEYQQSSFHREYVEQRVQSPVTQNTEIPVSSMTFAGLMTQWWTLARRCFQIKLKDTWITTILLAQAPFVALLILFVFGKDISQKVTEENWATVARKVSMTIFMMSLSSLWFGSSNAAREIVGEWAIYHRERMVNLRISTYLASKITVLGFLCVIQCTVLAGVVHWGCSLRGSWLALFAMLLLSSFVGLSIGLLISALARSTEVAIALLPIVLIPMVILGGVMQPVHDMNPLIRVCASIAPSRWAFEGILLTEARARPLGPSPLSGIDDVDDSETSGRPDIAEHYFPKNERMGVATCKIVLMSMFVLMTGLILIVLRERDVHR